MKLLGEKELENEILRELIKKKKSAFPKSTKFVHVLRPQKAYFEIGSILAERIPD